MKINITIEIEDGELKDLLKGLTEKETEENEDNLYKVSWHDNNDTNESYNMAILNNLKDIASKYCYVSEADLKDYIGFTSVYTDNKYGWSYKMLRRGHVKKIGENDYRIDLPMPIRLP